MKNLLKKLQEVEKYQKVLMSPAALALYSIRFSLLPKHAGLNTLDEVDCYLSNLNPNWPKFGPKFQENI